MGVSTGFAVESHIINDIAICIVAAWGLGLLAQIFKQPLVLAYLVAGYAVGPMGKGWIQQNSIEAISEMGLILLLFMIGLEIDLKKILGAGRLILVTSAIQIGGGCLLGWLFFASCRGWLGIGALDVVYLSVAMALSSTVIIVKILYDLRELDTLAGRLTLGVLVSQDLFAIFFLAVQPTLQNPSLSPLLNSFGRVGLLMTVSFLASRYLLPSLFRAVARLPELVLVGALAWCFLVSGLASKLDLSREMGALIAGVSISTFPYTLDVAAKVTSLRDFFVTLFFVGLGMTIPAPTASCLGWSAVTALFVIASRLLTVFPTLYSMRMGHRLSLLTSIQLSQVSEFSLVILALGLHAGHVGPQTGAIVAYTFVLLAVASTYAITRPGPLLAFASRVLKSAGLPDRDAENPREISTLEAHHDIYWLGFFWTASSLLEEIGRHKPAWLPRLAIIDFNPEVHAKLKSRGIHAIYGDISRRETLAHAGLGHAKIILCTLPNMVLKGTDNLRLLQQLREINPTAQIIVHAETLPEAPKLYAAGASYVTLPRLLEADDLCEALEAASNGQLSGMRTLQESELEKRNEVIS